MSRHQSHINYKTCHDVCQAQFGHPLELFFSAENPQKNPQKIPTNKSAKNMIFGKNGRREALDGCKILPRGVGTIRRPGKHHSGKTSLNFFMAVQTLPGPRWDVQKKLVGWCGAP